MSLTIPKPQAAPFRVMPGFGLSFGFTIFYLGLIVLIPLSAVFLKTFTMTWEAFWSAVSLPRVVPSYKLSFGASLIAAAINVVFGGIVAWVLVRYKFPGKRFVDALVDLFALPTAVAGITLTALYSSNGWIGRYLEACSPGLSQDSSTAAKQPQQPQLLTVSGNVLQRRNEGRAATDLVSM